MDCWFFISLGLKCCGNVHETGRLKQSVWWTIQLISPRGVKNKFTIAELKKKGQKQEFHKTVITLVRATRHWMLRLPDAKTSLCVFTMSEQSSNLSTNWSSSSIQNGAYSRIELASACTLAFLSPITVATNILLITTIIKDPLNYFKKPTSYFVLGLSIADLLCGLLVEPFFALYFFVRYFTAGDKFQVISHTLFVISSIISTASLNASFVMVLMLSFVQFIAIEYPYKYKIWIRKRFALSSVMATWLYFTVFSLLPVLGMDQILFFKLNLTLHSTVISAILAVLQILIYRAFKGHLQVHKITRTTSLLFHLHSNTASPQKTSGKRLLQTRSRNYDRNFVLMTFYLAAILLFSAFPHIGVFYVFLYKQYRNQKEEVILNILLRITDLFLFVKAAADAFIFAWRLPSYRKSIRFLLAKKHDPQIETSV